MYNRLAPIEERFLFYVNKTDSCWLWLGGKCRGYGHFSIKRKSYKAHRVSYELFVGPIPSGLTIDHLCNVIACVNPAHLEPVTLSENVLRRPNPNPQPKEKQCVICGSDFVPHASKRKRQKTCGTAACISESNHRTAISRKRTNEGTFT